MNYTFDVNSLALFYKSHRHTSPLLTKTFSIKKQLEHQILFSLSFFVSQSQEMEGRQYYPPRETIDGGNRTTLGGPHSLWHSPVPYLFGGLAAMVGLIAFALVILGCSYWRLSGYFDGEEDQSRDLEAGDVKPDKPAKAVALPEKFLVIMAGDVNPTYLATPAEKSCTCDEDEDEEGGDDDVKGNDQVVRRNNESNGVTH
ncbi:unnamed protein product [Eruca vesicaria subsp. sativa]|uniref:Uncharacterized protein n=1 Tax=Eruca vesicaria subsp. sativa TaxID=29727 RepID=A0ABC8KZQ8_ERUVS|nr:unnamed protein product [Eruca vesicaria subsp. sativa]